MRSTKAVGAIGPKTSATPAKMCAIYERIAWIAAKTVGTGARTAGTAGTRLRLDRNGNRSP